MVVRLCLCLCLWFGLSAGAAAQEGKEHLLGPRLVQEEVRIPAPGAG